jgi:hypothetical protein
LTRFLHANRYLAIGMPALFAGSMLGVVAFRNINEVGFR